MRFIFATTAAVLLSFSGIAWAQVSGNIAYSEAGGRSRAIQNERNNRVLTKFELPPADSSFVEASVLLNVPADEYVAVFGVLVEGASADECGQKMDATIRKFTQELKELGVREDDVFVDFVAQNRIYGFEVMADIAREKPVGFELKKNIHIHYVDKSRLDQFVLIAARSQIFDLIKVDYIVKDLNAIQERLMEEASRIIRQKVSRSDKLLGIKLQPPAQIYAQRSSIYYPTEMYDSYRAVESEAVDASSTRQRYVTQNARKSRTFFFNGLDASHFDNVINPVIIEPVVQCTLYLKVKYEVQQMKK